MTVAFDALTSASAFTTTPDPFTFTHTPVGTPRAIVVTIAIAGSTLDQITGVTYGGVTMARIDIATESAGEVATTYLYFLGASIPTGAQTVSVDHTASAQSKKAAALSLTAADDTQVLVSGKIQADQANPQIALDTTTASSLRVSVIFSGHPGFGDVLPVTSTTAYGGEDFGANITRASYQDAASTGSFTIGWTATTEDVAMVAAAVQEIGAVVDAPFPFIGGGYYPVEG